MMTKWQVRVGGQQMGGSSRKGLPEHVTNNIIKKYNTSPIPKEDTIPQIT